MDNMSVILFLSVAVPILPVLLLLPDPRSTRFLGFLLIGMSICLIASKLNTMLLHAFGSDVIYVTTNITPMSEEILKALPVLFFACTMSDDRVTVISISFATGLGFALLENLMILTQNMDQVSIPWAFMRGLGAAFMHSTCTSMLGMGISYIRKRRKLFYCGTFSLLIAAIIYHAIFNALVQSRYRVFAFIMPTLFSIPIFLYYKRRGRSIIKN